MQSSEMLITVAVFAFVGFILWLVSAQARAKIRYRAEIQKELIAKFSSAHELAEFLNSDAGKILIRGAKEDESRPARDGSPKTAKESVAVAIAWGVLGLSVGVAIFVASGLTLAGAVFTALGVGFLVNAMLFYVLSRKWGTWNTPEPSNASTRNVS